MSIIKNIVSGLEYLLILALAVLVGSGFSSFEQTPIPYADWISSGIAILLLVGLSLTVHRGFFSLDIKSALALTFIIMAGFHMAGWTTERGMPFMYYLVMIAAGALADIYTVLIVFCLLTLGELAALFVPALLSHGLDPVYMRPLLYKCEPLGISTAWLFLAGLVPLLAMRKIERDDLPRSEPQQRRQPQVQVQAQGGGTTEVGQAKTQMFTVEYASELMTQSQVDELLSSVVYFMSRNFRSYSALGFIYDPMRQVFMLNSHHSKSTHIIKNIEFPIGSGIIGKIGSEKRSFMSGDISLYSEIGYYDSVEQINSMLAVPIISEERELLGALVIDSKDKNAFKDQDKETLKRFSYLAAALITNARMRMFQERAAHTFQIFYQASHQFTTALNFDEVFEVLFRMVPMVVPVTRLMGILLDEGKKAGVVHKISGPSPELAQGFEFPINTGLYSYCLQKRRIVSIPDFQQYESKYYRFAPEEGRNPALRSLMIFPITDDEYRCPALFSIESDQPNQFTGELEQTLATLIDNASVAFTRAMLYQRMERLATTDGLTELNNHRHFQELLAKELERSRRYRRPLSLLLMDIDHFKSFNDTYGHPVGDLVLKEIAACIRKSIRINDIPARYGGEEFVVIIPETDEKGAMVIAERIRKTIESHIIKSLDRELRVTISLGCASFPTHSEVQAELIESSDKALYWSKEHGRNQVTIYKQGMGGKEMKPQPH